MPEGAPVVGHARLVALHEVDGDVRPRTPVRLGGLGLKPAQLVDAGGVRQALEHQLDLLGGVGSIQEMLEVFRLAAELAVVQLAADVEGRARGRGQSLGAPEAGVVATGSARGGEQRAVATQLDEADVGLVQPLEGVEGDGAGVTEDHEALEGSVGLVEASLAAFVGDAVGEVQVSAFDFDCEPVAGEGDDAVAGRDGGGVGRLGAHAEPRIPCAVPLGLFAQPRGATSRATAMP